MVPNKHGLSQGINVKRGPALGSQSDGPLPTFRVSAIRTISMREGLGTVLRARPRQPVLSLATCSMFYKKGVGVLIQFLLACNAQPMDHIRSRACV